MSSDPPPTYDPSNAYVVGYDRPTKKFKSQIKRHPILNTEKEGAYAWVLKDLGDGEEEKLNAFLDNPLTHDYELPSKGAPVPKNILSAAKWESVSFLKIPLLNTSFERRPYVAIVGSFSRKPAMLLLTGAEDGPAFLAKYSATGKTHAVKFGPWHFPRNEGLALLAKLRIAHVLPADEEKYPAALKKLVAFAQKFEKEAMSRGPLTKLRMALAMQNLYMAHVRTDGKMSSLRRCEDDTFAFLKAVELFPEKDWEGLTDELQQKLDEEEKSFRASQQRVVSAACFVEGEAETRKPLTKKKLRKERRNESEQDRLALEENARDNMFSENDHTSESDDAPSDEEVGPSSEPVPPRRSRAAATNLLDRLPKIGSMGNDDDDDDDESGGEDDDDSDDSDEDEDEDEDESGGEDDEDAGEEGEQGEEGEGRGATRETRTARSDDDSDDEGDESGSSSDTDDGGPEEEMEVDSDDSDSDDDDTVKVPSRQRKLTKGGRTKIPDDEESGGDDDDDDDDGDGGDGGDGAAPQKKMAKGTAKKGRLSPKDERENIKSLLCADNDADDDADEEEEDLEAEEEKMKKLAQMYVDDGKRPQEYGLFKQVAKVLKLTRKRKRETRSLHDDVAFVEERMAAGEAAVQNQRQTIVELVAVEKVAADAAKASTDLAATIKKALAAANNRGLLTAGKMEESCA